MITIDDYLREMPLAKQVEALRSALMATERERDEARVAALGMFDPVKVGQVVAQLQMERDQAREFARRIYARLSSSERSYLRNEEPLPEWLTAEE